MEISRQVATIQRIPGSFMCLSSSAHSFLRGQLSDVYFLKFQNHPKLIFNQHFFKKIYLFMAVLCLRFCARAFSSCGERGPLFIVVRGPRTIAASFVAEHRLQTHRLSGCGPRAQLLRGMWDLPRPGLKPVCPALAGGLSTTGPPGKSLFT